MNFFKRFFQFNQVKKVEINKIEKSEFEKNQKIIYSSKLKIQNEFGKYGVEEIELENISQILFYKIHDPFRNKCELVFFPRDDSNDSYPQTSTHYGNNTCLQIEKEYNRIMLELNKRNYNIQFLEKTIYWGPDTIYPINFPSWSTKDWKEKLLKRKF